jgi:opacity protein-like surface antigen
MRYTMSARIAALCVIVVAVAMPAAAQNASRGEISAGYQLLGAKGDVDETLEKGWYADVAGNIGRTFSLVFQVSGNYKTFEETVTVGTLTTNVSVDLKVYEFMGGIRASARGSRTITPFAQFLAGGVHGSADVSGSVVSGGQTFFSTSTSDSGTDLGLQMGGGVNFQVSDAIGIRFAADYIRVFGDGEDLNAYRFAIGAVFPF